MTDQTALLEREQVKKAQKAVSTDLEALLEKVAEAAMASMGEVDNKRILNKVRELQEILENTVDTAVDEVMDRVIDEHIDDQNENEILY